MGRSIEGCPRVCSAAVAFNGAMNGVGRAMALSDCDADQSTERQMANVKIRGAQNCSGMGWDGDGDEISYYVRTFGTGVVHKE